MSYRFNPLAHFCMSQCRKWEKRTTAWNGYIVFILIQEKNRERQKREELEKEMREKDKQLQELLLRHQEVRGPVIIIFYSIVEFLHVKSIFCHKYYYKNVKYMFDMILKKHRTNKMMFQGIIFRNKFKRCFKESFSKLTIQIWRWMIG